MKKKIFDIAGLFKQDIDNDVPDTFREELNRQCRIMLLPVALVAVFSWLPYIEPDRHLHSGMAQLIYLRLGLTVMGAIVLLISLIPASRSKSYHLLFALFCYLELSAAAILGLVSADPIYMGGFCLLVLILPMAPFKRFHSLMLLTATVLLFTVVSIRTGTTFSKWADKYGLYNFLAALVVSIISTIVLDAIRKQNYHKSRLILKRNEELTFSAREISLINRELEASATDLSRTNEELQRANEIKSDLLGMAAHDLKNPLQVITGYTELLQFKMKTDSFASEKLSMIHQSSDKMLRLITGLLETASIRHGKLSINQRPINMEELVQSVVESNRQLASQKKQTLELSCENNCIVSGDTILLQEVMDNLVSNAIKFSPWEKQVWISLFKLNNTICFRVKDEGPGFTLDDKKRIFQKYQRLSAKPTGGESSTGLGLSIIRDLVELHKGEVVVESEYGKGCMFTVQLPAAGEEKTGEEKVEDEIDSEENVSETSGETNGSSEIN